jgi:ribose transport system substrate-binding protein
MATLVVLIAALVAGCGSSSNSSTTASTTEGKTESSAGSTSSGGSGEGAEASAGVAEAEEAVVKYESVPTEIPQDTPLTKAPPKGITAAALYENVPGNVLSAQGAEEAVKAVGWNYIKVLYNIAEPASFQAAVKTALQKGAEYLLVTGTPASLLGQSVINEIEDAGAKMVIASTFPEENKGPISTEAAVGLVPAGRVLADWFIADSHGEGHALFSNVAAYPILHQEALEFQKEAEEKCPGCSVEIAEFSKSDLEKGAIIPTLVNKLRANSEFEYLFFDYSGFGVGIESALAAAGVENVKIGGVGGEPESIEAIKKGTQSAWVGNGWPYQGYTEADRAMRFATGSEGGENDLEAPLMILTEKSIKQEGILDENGNFTPPLNALEQFEELWQVR